MLISTKGRYALRVMIDLAEHPSEQYTPLKEIADRQNISEKYLESIIKLLVRGGMLHGLRGKGGGYKLSMAPEQCTVGSVLRLTEEGLAPVSCLSQEPIQCPRAAECRTLPMWRELYRRINEYVDSVTLADLIAPDGGNEFII
ncbi:MAG: RrF2 family transcriptional regulator [Butyricicoccus sp.]